VLGIELVSPPRQPLQPVDERAALWQRRLTLATARQAKALTWRFGLGARQLSMPQTGGF